MSFEHTIEDVPTADGEGTESVTFVLKDISKIPMGILRKNRRNDFQATMATIEWGVDPEQLDQIDRLDSIQFYKMIEAWQNSADPDQDKPSPSRRPKTKTPAKADDSE